MRLVLTKRRLTAFGALAFLSMYVFCAGHTKARGKNTPSTFAVRHHPELKVAPIPHVQFSKYAVPSSSPMAFDVKLDFEAPGLRPFRRYRSLLTAAVADGKANFAGYFRLVDIPCGTGCRYWWMVDLRNGAVLHTPSEKPVRFNEVIAMPNSRLVLFKGPATLIEDQCQFAYYQWVDSQRAFRAVKQGIVQKACG